MLSIIPFQSYPSLECGWQIMSTLPSWSPILPSGHQLSSFITPKINYNDHAILHFQPNKTHTINYFINGKTEVFAYRPIVYQTI